MKQKLLPIVQFILNPRLILCFGTAWFITNGWAYIMLAAGGRLGISWMTAVSGAYLAFLWLPISPEKIVTAAIAVALLRFLFPRDEKTLAVIIRMKDKIRAAFLRKKNNTEKT